MKKTLTSEEIEIRKKKNKKIIKYFILPIIFMWIIILLIPSDKESTSNSYSTKKINMDSLVSLVKHDSLYEIKDAYYNKIDSSFSIAFTNKENTITDKSYSTYYFNQNYHLDSLDEVEGVYLFAYKAGKSFSKGDYKNPLTFDSKRLGRITNDFDSKFYSDYLKTYKPVYDYLKQTLNDPSSLEIEKSWNLGMNDDSTFEVKTSFRAKNSFGALMLHTINCNIDMSGNLSNIKSDE